MLLAGESGGTAGSPLSSACSRGNCPAGLPCTESRNLPPKADKRFFWRESLYHRGKLNRNESTRNNIDDISVQIEMREINGEWKRQEERYLESTHHHRLVLPPPSLTCRHHSSGGNHPVTPPPTIKDQVEEPILQIKPKTW